MAIYAELADGRVLEFPDGTDPSVVQRTVKNLIASETPPEEGVGAALKGGAKRFASTIQTGIESLFDAEAAAKAGLERQKAISEQYAPGADLEAVKRAYAERGLLPAAGEAISQIPGALAEQFPNIAAALASGRAGAIAGGRVGGVRGALVGGVTGAAAPSLAQLFGSGLERQAEEGTDISRGRALAAAVPGAALEVASTFIPLGRSLVGKILGPQAEAALVRGNRAAVERMAKESLAGAAARGVGVGALAEIPTEITQQILERAQAGLDLTSDDALAEYGQAAYGAGLVGAPFGALGRVGQRGVARGQLEQEAAARTKEEQRVAAEAEAQRKLTPEYRQELNGEIVAAKDELSQLQAVLKDKTVDAEVKKEAQAKAKELAATIKEKTAELNRAAREAGVAPTLTEALAKQTKTTEAEQVIVDDFGNVLKPTTEGLTEEEVAAGYKQQAAKVEKDIAEYYVKREKDLLDLQLQQEARELLQDEVSTGAFDPAALAAELEAAELQKESKKKKGQQPAPSLWRSLTQVEKEREAQNVRLQQILEALADPAQREELQKQKEQRTLANINTYLSDLESRDETAAKIQQAKEQKQATDDIALFQLEKVLNTFGLRAAGLEGSRLARVQDGVNRGVVNRYVASALGIPGLKQYSVAAEEVVPALQKRREELRNEISDVTSSGAELIDPAGGLTESGLKFAGAQAKLQELDRLLTVAESKAPAQTRSEFDIESVLERTAAEGAEPEATPIQKGKAKKFYADKAIEANKQASGSFTDFTAYLDDYRRGTFFGEKGAKRDVQAASYTRAGLLRETEDARKQVVDNLINEISYRRMEQGGRPFTRNEAIKFAIDVNAILSELADRSTALPSGYFLGKIVQPAQMRGTEIVKSAEEVLTDTRDLDQRPLGAPQRAAEVLAEAVKIAKDKAIAEGKRPVRADKPLLKQQFKTQPTESQIAQGERVVNEIEQVLAGGVKEDIASVLNQAADIIANRRANPTFLNTVDEQIDRIRTGIDKTDKPENLALFKEIKQDLDTQAAIRAFVEGEQTTVVPKGKRFQEVDVQEDLFPETVATKRATPATFQRLQKSQEVTAKREKIAEGKAKAEQIRKEAKSAKEEFDRLVSPQNIRDEKVKVLEQIQQLIAKTQREIQEGIELKKTRSPKYKQFTDELLKLSKDIDVNKLEFEVTEGGARVTFVSPEILESWARLDTRIKKAVAKVKELETLAKQAKEGSLEQRKAQAAARQQAMALKLIKDKRNDAADAIAKQKVLMQERLATGLGLPGTKVTTEFETVTAGGKEFTRKVRKIAQLENSFLVGEKKQVLPTEFAMGFGKMKEVKPGIEPKKPPTKEELKAAAEERKKQLEFGRLTPQEAYNKLLADARRQRISVDKAEAKLVAYEEGVSEGKVKENLTTHKGLINAVDKARARLKNTLNFLGTVSGANYNPEAAKKSASQKTVKGPITPGEKRVIGTQAFDILGYGDRFGGPRTYDVDGTTDFRLGDKKPAKSVDYATAEKRLKEIKAKVDEMLKAGAKGKEAPVFEFYPNTAQDKISAAMIAQGLDPLTDSVKGGVFPNGTVFVVVNAHDSMLDLEQTIAHELIGHYSVETLLGRSGMEKLMLRLDKDLATAKEESGLQILANRLGLVNEYEGAMYETYAFYKDRLDKGEISEKEVRRIAKANGLRELIAYTVERKVDKPWYAKAADFIKEIVRAVRSRLKYGGLTEVAKQSTSDLFYLMKQAQDNFTAGKPLTYRNEDGTVSFRSQKMSPAEGVAKAVGMADDANLKSVFSLGISPMSRLALRTKLLDRWAPIQEIVSRGTKAGVKNFDSLKAQTIMYFSRLSDQRNNFTAQALTNGVGDIQEVQGELKYVGRAGASMKKVAERLGKGDSGVSPADLEREFTGYAIARRAKRVGVDKLDYAGANITQADVDATLNKYKGNKAFEEAFEIYQDYNTDLLNFAAKAGFLTEKEAKDLSSTRDYVPYYRVRGQNIELYLGNERVVKVGNLRNNPDLAELVGGKEKILPIFQSAALNTQMLIGRSVNNMAIRNVAWGLRDLGIVKGNAVSNGEGAADPNVVRWKEKGEWKHVVVDTQLKSDLFGDIPTELVIQGLEGIPTAIPFVVRMMSKPANLLRKFITRNPKYAVNQIYRDSMAASMTTGANFIPVFDTLKNLVGIVSGKSQTAKELQGSGILGGQVVTGMPEDIQKIINQISTGRTGWELAMAKLDEIAMAADTATRESMYKSFIRQGLSPRMAEYATLEAMNFSRRGTSPSMHFLNMMIPFFNANVQGLDVLWRAFKGDMPESERLRVQTKLIQRGIMMAAFTVAYATMWQDDEAYENANPDERYSNWFIPIPGLREPLRVPIPFELGFFFKALPEGVYRALATDDKAGDVAIQMKNMFLRSTPLIDPGGALGVTPELPAGIKPIIEVVMNKDLFSDRPIVDARLEKLETTQQYRDSTPAVVKALAPVYGVFGISPVQLEHLIRGYTGTFPLAMAKGLDYVMPGVEKPSIKLTEFPVVGTMFQPVDAGGLVNAAYKVVEDTQKASATYKDLLVRDPKEAQTYLEKNINRIGFASAAGRFRQQMGEIAAYKRQINNSDLPNDEKRRRLDEIRKIEIAYAKQFTSVYGQIARQ